MTGYVLAAEVPDYAKGLVVLVVLAAFVVMTVIAVTMLVTTKRYMKGETSREYRMRMLREMCFNGRVYVDFDPVQWQLDIPAVRAIAAQQGYVAAAPRYTGTVAFGLPSPLTSPSYAGPADGAVSDGHPEPVSVAQPTAHESSMLKRIREEGKLWMSLREHGIPGWRIDSLLGASGMRIALHCGDSTDELVLAYDPQRVTSPLAEGQRGMRPMAMLLVLVYTTALVLVGGMSLLWQQGYDVLGALSVILIPGIWVMPYSMRPLSRARRVALLNKEFGRGKKVSIYLRWYGLSDRLVTEIAWACGYRYSEKSVGRIGEPYIGYRSVEAVPSGTAARGPAAGGQPETQTMYSHESTVPTELSNRESSLLATVREEGEAWISLRQYRLSRARLDMLAGTHGIQLARVCADSIDQLILLRAHPEYRGEPRTPAAKGIRPSFVVIIMSFALAVSYIVPTAVLGYFGYAVIACCLTVPIFFVLLLPRALRLLSRSRRARLLNSEFNGRPCVSIFLQWYGFSDYLASEMATYCGYRYGEKKYHSTQGPYINYVRMV